MDEKQFWNLLQCSLALWSAIKITSVGYNQHRKLVEAQVGPLKAQSFTPAGMGRCMATFDLNKSLLSTERGQWEALHGDWAVLFSDWGVTWSALIPRLFICLPYSMLSSPEDRCIPLYAQVGASKVDIYLCSGSLWFLLVHSTGMGKLFTWAAKENGIIIPNVWNWSLSFLAWSIKI